MNSINAFQRENYLLLPLLVLELSETDFVLLWLSLLLLINVNVTILIIMVGYFAFIALVFYGFNLKIKYYLMQEFWSSARRASKRLLRHWLLMATNPTIFVTRNLIVVEGLGFVTRATYSNSSTASRIVLWYLQNCTRVWCLLTQTGISAYARPKLFNEKWYFQTSRLM